MIDIRDIVYRDSKDVFKEAIESGVLSDNPNADNFAGKYMYMGTYGTKDQFKNIVTRKYL